MEKPTTPFGVYRYMIIPEICGREDFPRSMVEHKTLAYIIQATGESRNDLMLRFIDLFAREGMLVCGTEFISWNEESPIRIYIPEIVSLH